MRWLAALILSASQASALSCLPPDPVRTFLEVDAAPERWGAVFGRLDFDTSAVPQPTGDDTLPPSDTWLRAHLVGTTLDADGWTKPFQGNIELDVQCVGPWCARPVSGATYLLFLKREPGRHIAIIDPCGTYSVQNPAREVLDSLYQCFADGPCEPAPLQ